LEADITGFAKAFDKLCPGTEEHHRRILLSKFNLYISAGRKRIIEDKCIYDTKSKGSRKDFNKRSSYHRSISVCNDELAKFYHTHSNYKLYHCKSSLAMLDRLVLDYITALYEGDTLKSEGIVTQCHQLYYNLMLNILKRS
jgi:hypothetical protein